LDSNPGIADLEKRIQRILEAPKAQPMTRSELARALEVPSKDRSNLRQAIRNLEERGAIEEYKKSRYGLPRPASAKGETWVGVVEFPSPGKARNGWIEANDESRRSLRARVGKESVFFGERNSGTALPGDTVRFSVFQGPPPAWQRHVKKFREEPRARWEAKIEEIVRRKRQHYVGTLHLERGYGRIVPDEPAFHRDCDTDVAALPPGAEDRCKVVFELTAWTSPLRNPKVKVVRVLGPMGAPGVDILSIIHRYDLPLDFPEAVLLEASTAPIAVAPDEIEGREDWRDAFVLTIDPFDARDFDDAICVRRLDHGGWELAVFIADVAHYVRAGGAVDKEARKRGNSVYLVDRVIPMLPFHLSNGICSLNPHVDRLTHAVIMEFDAQGHRAKARFAKAVIRSKRRFSYEEAFAFLDQPLQAGSEGDAPFSQALHEAWNLAGRLRQLRMEHGSLDLDFPEVKVILNEAGEPIDVRLVVYDISHQLIEEFMLAANEAVAEFIKNRLAGAIYRVHEDPDPEKLFDFRELAMAYGHPVGDVTIKNELQKLLRTIRGKPEEHVLKLSLLKSLKRAVYSEEPFGHYGLAKQNYCHFTSPIRRYADLVVHRVLEKLATSPETARPLPKKPELAETAEHLSTTERTAASAEQESKLLKQYEYLMRLMREKKDVSFEAVVTEILPRGAFVELQALQLRGLLKSADLPLGYEMEPRMQRIIGPRGKIVARAGMIIPVRVLRVDLERKHLDFALVTGHRRRAEDEGSRH
jgi:ribonuclease R